MKAEGTKKVIFFVTTFLAFHQYTLLCIICHYDLLPKDYPQIYIISLNGNMRSFVKINFIKIDFNKMNFNKNRDDSGCMAGSDQNCERTVSIF